MHAQQPRIAGHPRTSYLSTNEWNYQCSRGSVRPAATRRAGGFLTRRVCSRVALDIALLHFAA